MREIERHRDARARHRARTTPPPATRAGGSGCRGARAPRTAGCTRRASGERAIDSFRSQKRIFEQFFVRQPRPRRAPRRARERRRAGMRYGRWRVSGTSACLGLSKGRSQARAYDSGGRAVCRSCGRAQSARASVAELDQRVRQQAVGEALRSSAVSSGCCARERGWHWHRSAHPPARRTPPRPRPRCRRGWPPSAPPSRKLCCPRKDHPAPPPAPAGGAAPPGPGPPRARGLCPRAPRRRPAPRCGSAPESAACRAHASARQAPSTAGGLAGGAGRLGRALGGRLPASAK